MFRQPGVVGSEDFASEESGLCHLLATASGSNPFACLGLSGLRHKEGINVLCSIVRKLHM